MAQYKKDDSATLDGLMDEILTDAYGEDEQLWAFRQAFEDDVELPADAFVIGEPVSVVEIDYNGNERRGLTAKCRREDGTEHVIAASDVVFASGTSGARHVAAYRKFLLKAKAEVDRLLKQTLEARDSPTETAPAPEKGAL